MLFKKIFTAVFITSIILNFFSACSSNKDIYDISDDDKLSQEEKEELLIYYRHMILNSNMKLSIKEKEIIKNKKPDIRVIYNGYKQGRMSINWTIHEKRIFCIVVEGDLTETKNCRWHVSIMKM